MLLQNGFFDDATIAGGESHSGRTVSAPPRGLTYDDDGHVNGFNYRLRRLLQNWTEGLGGQGRPDWYGRLPVMDLPDDVIQQYGPAVPQHRMRAAMRARQVAGMALAGVLAASATACGADDGGSMKVSGNCGLGDNTMEVEKVLPTSVIDGLLADGDYKAIGGLIVRDDKLPAAFDGECALQEEGTGRGRSATGAGQPLGRKVRRRAGPAGLR